MVQPTKHINKLSLSFDRNWIDNTRSAQTLNSVCPAYKIECWGLTGILTIEGTIFNVTEPLVFQICQVITKLVQTGVFKPYVKIFDFRIHAIELKYSFDIFNPFLINSSGFTQCGAGCWQSNDFRRVYRSDGEYKGSQSSFIYIANSFNGSNLIFNLSGRKRQYLSIAIFRLTMPELFIQLIPILSCYLTQTVTPYELDIEPGVRSMLSSDFIALFDAANWFGGNNQFVKKRVGNNVRGRLTVRKKTDFDASVSW